MSLKLIANNKRGGARRRTKRSVQRRNNAPKSNGFAQDTRVAKLAIGKNLVFGFPDRMVTKLRYNQIVTLTSGGAGIVGYAFVRANDIFNPFPAGGGHQPMYRDTYAAIYENYAVVSSKISVKFMNTLTTPIKVGAVIDNGTSTSTDPVELSERNHGKHMFLPPQGGSLSTIMFTVPWSARSILGIDPFTSEAYKTLQTASPADASNFQLWMYDVVAYTGSVLVDFTVEYEVLMTELITAPLS